MNMTRRDMLKLSGVTAVAAATVTLTGCASEPKPACDKENAAGGKKAIK
ncbi:MAG: hypothetical protein QG567_1919, partial [Campylobacterota bacterium]|nr:hypothetical protein [Campylobacterota bacterium]